MCSVALVEEAPLVVWIGGVLAIEYCAWNLQISLWASFCGGSAWSFLPAAIPRSVVANTCGCCCCSKRALFSRNDFLLVVGPIKQATEATPASKKNGSMRVLPHTFCSLLSSDNLFPLKCLYQIENSGPTVTIVSYLLSSLGFPARR